MATNNNQFPINRKKQANNRSTGKKKGNARARQRAKRNNLNANISKTRTGNIGKQVQKKPNGKTQPTLKSINNVKNIRNKKRNRNSFRKLWMIFIVMAFLLIFFIWPKKDPNEQGLKFLINSGNKNPEDISDALKKRQKEEITRMIDNGEIDLATLLTDTCILGDSRAVPFTSTGYIPQEYNLSVVAVPMTDINDHLEEVKALQPANIVFIYGGNDIGQNLDQQLGKSYKELYEEYVGNILEVSPNSKIIICGMIPGDTERMAKNPAWANYTDYNKQIQEACEENGWTYVDTSQLNLTDADYTGDGFHVYSYVYPKWAELIAEAIWGWN